jgi:predicted nucleic acid-binding protein
VRALVVDASVAVKWMLPEVLDPLSGQANELLDQYARGQLALVVPDLFWSELANVLWKSVRQKKIPAVRAQQALDATLAQGFRTIPGRDVLSEALTIALHFDRTVYDSLYLAVAVALNTHLITADERLANALAAHLPVKWLGSYSI